MSFITYLKETKEELKHVSWPTRKQVIVFTALVIAISFIVAAFLGFFDTLFTFLLDKFVV